MAQEIKQDVNIGGNLNVNDDVTISAANAALSINAGVGEAPRLYLKVDGTTKGEMWQTASGLMVRSYGATQTNRMDMFDAYTRFDHDVQTNAMGTGSNSLTTKAYVDDADALNLKLTGGTVDGQITTVGDLTVGQGDANNTNATLYLNSGSGNPAINFKREGTDTASIVGLATRLELNSGTSSLKIYDGIRADFNTIVRASDPIGATDLTTKGYVDDLDGFNVKTNLASQTINGDLAINDLVSNPVVSFERNGTQLGYVAGLVDSLWLNKTGGGFLKIYDDKIVSSEVIEGVTPTADVHLTTKLYVDDNFVDLTTAQTIGGDKTFTGATTRIKAASGHTFVVADATSGSQGQLLFREAGASKGALYDAGVLMRIRRNHSAAGTNTDIDLRDDYIQLNKVAFGVTPTADAHLSTKAYVDDNFMGIDNNQDITGDKVFINNITVLGQTGQHSKVRVKAVDTQEAAVLLYRDEVAESALYSLDTRTLLRRWATGTNSELNIYDTYFDFNKVVRGVTPVGTTDLTTKAYVDNNFVGKNGEATSVISFQPSGNNDWRFYSTDTSSNLMRFYNHDGTSNVLESWINANADSITLRKFDSVEGNTEFSVRGDYVTTNKTMRAATPVDDADLTRKDYVDDNTNVVQQTTGYQFVMPAATPTAGQSLEVGSVSGTTVTMVWV